MSCSVLGVLRVLPLVLQQRRGPTREKLREIRENVWMHVPSVYTAQIVDIARELWVCLYILAIILFFVNFVFVFIVFFKFYYFALVFSLFYCIFKFRYFRRDLCYSNYRHCCGFLVSL